MTGLCEDLPACFTPELLRPCSAYMRSFGICALHIFGPIMLVTRTHVMKIN